MIGEVVSHYEILDKLGEGGMGVVYRARDLRLRRFVALKFLPPEITATPERSARFEQEARAISALNHPHIATIHAMEESGDRRFLVLECLTGGTLRQRMKAAHSRGRPFRLSEAIKIGIETAQGLAHAHRKGVVHRDIKPENVMFTADGLLRITDFGLAKSGDSELTREGTTVGTAAYMAPEQAMRNETSPRSDLFSLGVMLHELIAGERPFAGASEFAIMQAVVQQTPAPLSQFRRDAPAGLQRILSRLLEKDPALRYQTGVEVASELSALDIEPDDKERDGELPALELNYSGLTQTMAQANIASPGRKRLKNYRLAGWATVAVLVAAAAAGVSMRLRSPRTVDAAATQLAVLPFTATSGNPEDVAFSNGLAGIVSGRLAALGGNVWVIPDNDLHQNRVATPMDAHKIFGVASVITGEVTRRPSREVGVEMHLIDTASGRILRSASVKPGDSTMPLEEEVVREAAAILNLSLDPLAVSKLRAVATQTANAYDYYVLGNGYLQRYDQAGNIGSAIAAFKRAIQLDSSYAMAYAGLSSAYLRQYRSSSEQQYLENARDAAMQALSRNESLDSPHITLGTIAMLTGQTDEGIKQLRAGLDRDPVNADAYRELAAAYVQAGKPAEAEATYNRAIQLRPNFWLGYLDSATFYFNNARYADAEKALRTAVGLTPDNYLLYRNLGAVQTARGEWADAEHSLKQALGARPGGSVYSNFGTLYIYTGRYADAVAMLEQAVALSIGDNYAYLIWGNLGDAYRLRDGNRTAGRETSAGTAYGKAITLARSHLAVNPKDPTLLSQIAVYQAKIGEFAQAEAGIRDALRLAPSSPAVLYRSALVLELAGDRAKSLKNLSAAIAAGYSASVVEGEPDLASLRKDPGYSAVAARMATREAARIKEKQ